MAFNQALGVAAVFQGSSKSKLGAVSARDLFESTVALCSLSRVDLLHQSEEASYSVCN